MILLTLVVKNFALEIGFGTKVKQEANFVFGGIEIVEELSLIVFAQTSRSFEFDNDTIFHQYIGKKFAHHLTIIVNIDGVLASNQ